VLAAPSSKRLPRRAMEAGPAQAHSEGCGSLPSQHGGAVATPRQRRPDRGGRLCADAAARRRPGGFVVTVVRGTGDDAARSRLRSGYDTGDAGLLETFDRLAEGRLKVFAGAP